MNLKKLTKSVARVVKENPEAALIVAGLVAPKLARKLTPVVAAVSVDDAAGRA